MFKFSLLSLAALLLISAAPAEAQLYSWRDANGNLVIADHPGGPNQKTYAVAKSTSVRTTRAPSADYRNQYDGLIKTNAKRYGVRADLVRAVIQAESAFNPRARSPKGAMGLMQLMPATAREVGVIKPYDPVQNIRGGVAYLRQLLDRYEENEELALAAYNAGPGAVDRYGYTVPPFRETQEYVSRIKTATDVSTVSTSKPAPPSRVIYKTTELVDGRLVAKYTDNKPLSGNYEVIGLSR